MFVTALQVLQYLSQPISMVPQKLLSINFVHLDIRRF